MTNVVRSRRRRRAPWLQILGAPTIEITMTDIMSDLDPNWNIARSQTRTHSGEPDDRHS